MRLGVRPFTAGDKRKYSVSYDSFLAVGATLASATVTTPDVNVTISSINYVADPRAVSFFVQGGTHAVPFTVTVSVTDSTAQVITDTIDFNPVVNPDGS